MDVETRLLLYVVEFGAAAGMYLILRRRAWAFWAHVTVLAILMGAGFAALFAPGAPWSGPAADAVVAGFLGLVVVPSVALSGARALAARGRFAVAERMVRAGALLLGLPRPLLHEARFYACWAAVEAGDPVACERHLAALAVDGAIPAWAGGAVLRAVLPRACANDWDGVLGAIDAAREAADTGQSLSQTVLTLEARAAAEAGDLVRAGVACARLREIGAAAAAQASARRAVLAVAGRVAFLRAARERRLPVMRARDGFADLAIARAAEAAGDLEAARAAYRALATHGRGRVARDAAAGAERIERGAPLVWRGPVPDEILAIERQAASETPLAPERPYVVTRAATIALVGVTTIASAAVFALLGSDALSLLAAGALSAPLVLGEGEWWRLGATAFLHANDVHLVLNMLSIVIIGGALEPRIGAARLLVVYVATVLFASVASVLVNGTPIGVGASGGAMGLMGALLYLVHARGDLFDGRAAGAWKRLLWLSLAATAVLGVLEADYVDNAAHAAGFLGGVALAWGLCRRVHEPVRSGVGLRAAAGLLTGVLLVCGVLAAAGITPWRTTREIAAPGVRARVPAWLRTEEIPGRGTVGWRDPVDLVIQIGARPYASPAGAAAAPLPAARGVLADVARQLAEAPPREGSRAAAADDLSEERFGFEPESWEDVDPMAPFSAAIDVVVLRRGRAFAVVVLPGDAESQRVLGPVLDELRATLREQSPPRTDRR